MRVEIVFAQASPIIRGKIAEFALERRTVRAQMRHIRPHILKNLPTDVTTHSRPLTDVRDQSARPRPVQSRIVPMERLRPGETRNRRTIRTGEAEIEDSFVRMSRRVVIDVFGVIADEIAILTGAVLFRVE